MSIIMGAMLISRPQFSRVTTTYVLGTYGLIFRVVLADLGLRLRRLSSGYAGARRCERPPQLTLVATGIPQFPFVKPSMGFTQHPLDSIACAGCGRYAAWENRLAEVRADRHK